MEGAPGLHRRRTGEGARRQDAVLRSRGRQPRAAHENHLGFGADLADASRSVEAVESLDAIDCHGSWRRESAVKHELIHAAGRRRENRCGSIGANSSTALRLSAVTMGTAVDN